MKHLLRLLSFFFLLTQATAQSDTSALKWTISGYAESYYGYDLNQPKNSERPGFIYSHNRHNEFNINLAYIKGAVNTDRTRANLALMAGTYANANLASEPGTLRNVLEANAGVKLSKKHNVWIDAGIFGSHIGFESAISKDCWALTRSLLAENSPYYEAGAKLTYTSKNEKWMLSALALNGWQRIQRVPGNSLLSGGWQIMYKPNARITLNSSGFVGTDKPDAARLIRVFHNFYGIFQLNNAFGLTLGLDTGWEESPVPTANANFWFSPILIARYALNDRIAIAARAELYDDANGVIIATGTPNGFQTLGFSANLDVTVHKNALWRLEGRILNSQDDIFVRDGRSTNTNGLLVTSLAVWF
jgi:hypothetical protein